MALSILSTVITVLWFLKPETFLHTRFTSRSNLDTSTGEYNTILSAYIRHLG